jgi:hypothetical protein
MRESCKLVLPFKFANLLYGPSRSGEFKLNGEWVDGPVLDLLKFIAFSSVFASDGLFSDTFESTFTGDAEPTAAGMALLRETKQEMQQSGWSSTKQDLVLLAPIRSLEKTGRDHLLDICKSHVVARDTKNQSRRAAFIQLFLLSGGIKLIAGGVDGQKKKNEDGIAR